MSTVASEKNRKLLEGIVVYRATCFTNSDISGCCFNSNSRADLLKIENLNPQQESDFRYGKKKFPERAAEMESRSRSQLKGAWPNVCTESK